MENMGYEYSPIITRGVVKWPSGARVAIWVIPNIEYYEFDLPFAGTGVAAGHVPDIRNYAAREYGLRVGIWRLMDVLDKYGIKATVALNSSVCDHSPIIIEEGKKRGWEFMGHGITNSKPLMNLSEEEERKTVRSAIRRITDAVGKRPEGWLSPGLAETFNTRDILIEEGIRYLCDWVNDDQPYVMRMRTGTIVSLPYSVELNDLPAFLNYHVTPQEFNQMIRDQFDALYEEASMSGRVMAIALHPFIIGAPFRIKCLDDALEYITRHRDVWFATGSEIVNWWCEHYLGL